MKSLSYIVPVIEYKKDYLEKCIKSLTFEDDEQLVIVGPTNVLNDIKVDFSDYEKHTTYVDNNDVTDYCTQVNIGVHNCNGDYFMIVEFDDELTPTWVKNVEYYKNHYTDVSLFLPLIEMVDDKDRERRALANELSWSTAFVSELGYIDTECLENFYDFNIVGGVFKKTDFVKAGGLKPSLKIAATYELLLRFCHNGFKIFTIPKVGYWHTFGRDGSYMVESRNTITQEEGEWLIKTAKEEKLYHDDRNKVFVAE